jgi:hypothetical protein
MTSRTTTLLLLFLFASSQFLFGGVVTLDIWNDFAWPPVQGQNSTSNPPWTITTATTTYFVIVDGYNSGDRFEAFDNAVSLGQTTASTTNFSGCVGGDTPTNCLQDSNFSHGVFALSAGSHSLTIGVTENPWNSGGAWFAVLSRDPLGSSVPEPATFVLSGAGLLAAAALARRRQRASR